MWGSFRNLKQDQIPVSYSRDSGRKSNLLYQRSEAKWGRSVVSDSATPWTVAYQAPQSTDFSRQEYWSGLPFPSPGDLPDPGIEPGSPALQADALPSESPGKPLYQRGFLRLLANEIWQWGHCVHLKEITANPATSLNLHWGKSTHWLWPESVLKRVVNGKNMQKKKKKKQTCPTFPETPKIIKNKESLRNYHS